MEMNLDFIAKACVSFLAAAVGAVGFALMFRLRPRALLPGALLGGAGYVLYLFGMQLSLGAVASSLLGAALVGVLGELAARRMKMPALALTTIGAIPLVPGYGLYQTMLYFVEGQNQLALATGVETLLVAGAIAVALGIAAAVSRSAGGFLHKKEKGGDNGKEGGELGEAKQNG